MSKCKTCGAPVNLAPDGDPRFEMPYGYISIERHRAEVERLTRELRELHQINDRNGAAAGIADLKRAEAEAALAAERKRARDEVNQAFRDWRECCAMNGACGACVGEKRLNRHAALTGKDAA